MSPKVRLIGFVVTTTICIAALGYMMPGVPFGLVFMAVVVVGLITLYFYFKHRKNSRIVKCANCHRRMTYRRFMEEGGCPICGTDLYIPLNKRAS